jgi:hypothetical protein
MVRITDTAAEVLHGHADTGGPHDAPKGSVIHSYPFAKFGREKAIKMAYAMHEAIMKSEERSHAEENTNAKTSFAEDMWVDAFKTGKHTDSAGNVREWTPEDLQKIATTYNETKDRKAPVVIGHPQHDSPAYGWVDSLRIAGNKLQAKLTELNDGFVEALKAGAYKMRSISLYPNLNVRHLGFLGGAQPAIAGLAPFKFEDNDNATTYEFTQEDEMAEFTQEDVKSLKRENSFFKKVFDLFKIDTQAVAADHVETATENKGAENMAETKTVETPVVETPAVAPVENFAEQIATLKTELAAVTAERDTLKAEAVSTEVKARLAEHKSFCDALVAEGRMRPVDLEQHVLNMELRFGADAGKFSETNKETTSLNSYKEYLGSLPKVVYFEEIATKGKASDHSEGDVSDKVAKFCDEKMSKNKGMSYSQALKEVGVEHPEEMTEYMNSQV